MFVLYRSLTRVLEYTSASETVTTDRIRDRTAARPPAGRIRAGRRPVAAVGGPHRVAGPGLTGSGRPVAVAVQRPAGSSPVTPKLAPEHAEAPLMHRPTMILDPAERLGHVVGDTAAETGAAGDLLVGQSAPPERAGIDALSDLDRGHAVVWGRHSRIVGPSPRAAERSGPGDSRRVVSSHGYGRAHSRGSA